jgi:hypothetical protein
MSTANLRERLRRRVRAMATETRYRLGLPEPGPGAARLAGSFRHPIDARLRPVLVARYRERFSEAADAEIVEARRLAAHRFTFLGHTVDHGDRIRWNLDPVSGREWSDGFSPAIPYRGPGRVGDIKLPWELSKHQYFFTLGKAAWLTGDPSFTTEIVRQIDDWIAANPYRRGVNWISALEVGARAVSWILAYPFYADHLDGARRDRLAQALARHMTFVEEHLSTGPFANNHLIGDAAALVAGGLFLDHRRSRRWLETGLHHLEAEMVRQVPADGVHVEQSVAYHRFVLDQYHLVRVLLAANGRTPPPAIIRGIERMTQYLMDVLSPQGSAPAFGDGDDARGLWLRHDAPGDYRSLLALAAVLFSRGDFKTAAGAASEEILWLLGPDALDRFDAIPAQRPGHTSTAFPDSGYYVMRSGWERGDAVLVFDCGPLGYGRAGHGHADALSFQLHAKGYPFLVDPGPYSYNLDYQWRDAFRATRAHNTVVVDGSDQSVAADRMSWSRQAHAKCQRWLSTEWFDLVDGWHDGYERLQDPVTHRRIVAYLKPDVWIVRDLLHGEAGHEIETLLHVRPDCEVVLETTGFQLRAPSGPTLRGQMFDAAGDARAPAVLSGTDAERQAWFSPGYGTRVPSRALSLSQQLSGHGGSAMWLSVSTDAEVHLEKADGVLSVRVRRGGQVEDRFVYRADGTVLLERLEGGRPMRIESDAAGAVRVARGGGSALPVAE